MVSGPFFLGFLMLTEEALVEAGYEVYPNRMPALHRYQRLLQKKMPRGYYISVQVYEGEPFMGGKALQPYVYLPGLPGKVKEVNVTLIMDMTADVEDLEGFCDTLHDTLRGETPPESENFPPSRLSS